MPTPDVDLAVAFLSNCIVNLQLKPTQHMDIFSRYYYVLVNTTVLYCNWAKFADSL